MPVGSDEKLALKVECLFNDPLGMANAITKRFFGETIDLGGHDSIRLLYRLNPVIPPDVYTPIFKLFFKSLLQYGLWKDQNERKGPVQKAEIDLAGSEE